MKQGVAIVGMSCRFPGADDLDAFWGLLVDGRCAVTTLTKTEAPADGGLAQVAAFGLLHDIDRVDHQLFGMTAREAALLDPQHRLWLELVWRALEDAQMGDRANLLTGVFASANRSAYLEHNIKQDAALAERLRLHSSSETRQILNANDREFLPLRTSFAFGFTGPSLNIQTACSSALAAVVSACRSLVAGESDIAVAGAVSVTRLSAEPMWAEPNAIHSASGRCRPFDAAADGAVFGDGGGALILRRVEDALADGDRIYAVIKGWGMSNDGGAKASFTAPNAQAQAQAIRSAWRMAAFPIETASYVEAHGTGTRLGDPIEVEGLRLALGDAPTRCWIGSVKGNIGHLDTAAGAAGLIKTALMLDRKTLVASANFTAPNPLLGLDDTRFRVADESGPWPMEQSLRAGVTALGVGGTNVHLVLEEAPTRLPTAAGARAGPHVLALSAQTPLALRRLCDAHAERLSDVEDTALETYCRAAAVGRRRLKYRAAICGEDADSLIAELRARVADPVPVTARARVAFVFSGQLSSYSGMGAQLYDAEPAFRRALLRCNGVLEPVLGRSLIDLLQSRSDELKFTRFEQPVLCAFQIALAQMWRAWGVQPSAVVGYSLGEFAAAHVAGAIDLADVLRLVAQRGQLMEEIPGRGAMVSVRGDPAGVSRALQSTAFEVAIIASDAPCIVSGDADPGECIRSLTEKGFSCRVVTDRYGFHSRWVDAALPGLAEAARAMRWRGSEIPFISSMMGEAAGGRLTDPSYWTDQARRPVRWTDALAGAEAAGCTIALELGPGTLAALSQGAALAFLPGLSPGRPERAAVKRTLGALHEHGVDIDWRSHYGARDHDWVDLPPYPFDYRSFWVGPLPPHRVRRIHASWSARDPAHLQDHRLFGRIIAPASSHIAFLLNAVAQEFKSDSFSIEDWGFLRPVVIPDVGEIDIDVTIEPVATDATRFSINARMQAPGELAVPFLTAELNLAEADSMAPIDPDTDRLDKEFDRARDGSAFYTQSWMQGDDTGPTFRRIEKVWSRDDEAVARIAERDDEATISAAVIEAGFQTLYAATIVETTEDLVTLRRTWVPYSIDRVRWRRRANERMVWSCAKHRPERRSKDSVVGTIGLFSADGAGLFEADGFQLRPLRAEAIGTEPLDDVYQVVLESTPVRPQAPVTAATLMIGACSPALGEYLAGKTSPEAILDAHAEDLHSACAAAAERLQREGRELSVLYVHEDAPESPNALAGCAGLLNLIHALDASDLKLRQLIVAVLSADGATTPAGAALEGLVRVLMNERASWNIKLVSLDRTLGSARLAEILSIELGQINAGEQSVYVGDSRRRRSLRSLKLAVQETKLRVDRAYLIVGPDDSQTQAVAHWMLECGAGKVVMATVGAKPSSKHELSPKLTKVGLDPANPDVEGLLAQCPGPLGGVVFIPWAMDDALLRAQTWDRFEAAVLPAMTALQRLSKLSEDLELEHFVCFSSSAAVLGAQGQASYAALTSFIDALCLERRAKDLPGLSVNWPPWHDMGRWVREGSSREAIATQGWRPIDAKHALSLLARAMTGASTPVAVLPLDWRVFSVYNGADSLAISRRMAPERPIKAAPVRPTKSATDLVADILGENLDAMPDTALLIELGLDSLMAVSLRNTFKRAYGADIPLDQLLSKTKLADIRALDTTPETGRE